MLKTKKRIATAVEVAVASVVATEQLFHFYSLLHLIGFCFCLLSHERASKFSAASEILIQIKPKKRERRKRKIKKNHHDHGTHRPGRIGRIIRPTARPWRTTAAVGVRNLAEQQRRSLQHQVRTVAAIKRTSTAIPPIPHLTPAYLADLQSEPRFCQAFRVRFSEYKKQNKTKRWKKDAILLRKDNWVEIFDLKGVRWVGIHHELIHQKLENWNSPDLGRFFC